MEAFPFVAIVGQKRIKDALLWNMVNPAIGGLLVSGEKGTAKSTLIRGINSLEGRQCVEELPLNADESSLQDSLDIEELICAGREKVKEGLFTRAKGKFLYIDEVNLLSDHIVNDLIEATGKNMRGALIGTMNPEEGLLRPQLLDRFGLYVEAESEKDLRLREMILKRRIAFDNNQNAFAEQWGKETEKLRENIGQARRRLEIIRVTENVIRLAVELVLQGGCESIRAELTLIETAKAIAALDGRNSINAGDLQQAAIYALPHRMKLSGEKAENSGAEDRRIDQQKNDETEQKPEAAQIREEEQPGKNEGESNSAAEEIEKEAEIENDAPEGKKGVERIQVDLPEESFSVGRWLADRYRKCLRRGRGRRSIVKFQQQRGRYVRSRLPKPGEGLDIAIDATLRAAAPFQRTRREQVNADRNGKAMIIGFEDIRIKQRERKVGNTIVFSVDASGSMGANHRMAAVKGAVLSLLSDAYQKRDRVGLVVFRNEEAYTALPITKSVELAQRLLETMPTGGRTPLAAGIREARRLINGQRSRDKDCLPVLVLISDGRATGAKGEKPLESAMMEAALTAADRIRTVVVDAEQGFLRLGLAQRLGEAMNADVISIEELSSDGLVASLSRILR